MKKFLFVISILIAFSVSAQQTNDFFVGYNFGIPLVAAKPAVPSTDKYKNRFWYDSSLSKIGKHILYIYNPKVSLRNVDKVILDSISSYSSALSKDYTGTLTGDGTLATNPVSLKYTWVSTGGLTTLKMRLRWNTSSATMTQLKIPLPADCPIPLVPADATSNLSIITGGKVVLQPSNTLSITIGSEQELVLVKDSGSPSGYSLMIYANAFSYQALFLSIDYENN